MVDVRKRLWRTYVIKIVSTESKSKQKWFRSPFDRSFPDKKAIISYADIRFDFLLPRYATIGSKNMGLIIDSSTNIQILDLLITQSPLAWLSCSFNAESPFRKVNFLFSKMFYFCFFCAEPTMRSCCMQWISPFVYSMTWIMKSQNDVIIMAHVTSHHSLVLQSHEATVVMWL